MEKRTRKRPFSVSDSQDTSRRSAYSKNIACAPPGGSRSPYALPSQLTAQPDEVRDARASGLTYVHDDTPGISRLRGGRSFRYRMPDGHFVRDAKAIDRITALAIPPAWSDVWICTSANGHLQATGRDAKGRKQYRYHAAWRSTRDSGKFDRVVSFGQQLPKLRAAVRKALVAPGFPREKVIAMVVAVLADTLIRVGNAAYAKENNSFGVTTLRNRHVDFVQGGRALFHFKGKSGKTHDIALDDKRLVKLIRKCQQLPGQALFQYIDENDKRTPVESGDVNAWLREIAGDDFTAKDFRTWAGTSIAFQRFCETPLPEGVQGKPPSERALASIEKAIVAEIAEVLGNTVAVCRKSYIDPAVFEAWRQGKLSNVQARTRGPRQWEAQTLAFLKRARRAKHR